MGELRLDPITARWVIIDTEKNLEPKSYKVDNPEIKGKICPFCLGNEKLTPPEVDADRDSNTGADTPGWQTRTVPNKYPVLKNELNMKKTGVGMFARAFMAHFPLIPVEEDGRFHDPKLRENFIEQVFTMKRWRDLLKERRNIGRIVGFHTRHKLLLLSHSEKIHRMMGKLVAGGKGMSIKRLYSAYETLLMEALRLKATSPKNSNVLQHLTGYLKKQLSLDEKQEVLEIIHQYRSGAIPLIVPVTLINHFLRKYDQPYLSDQVYLNPHPIALQLRNHV